MQTLTLDFNLQADKSLTAAWFEQNRQRRRFGSAILNGRGSYQWEFQHKIHKFCILRQQYFSNEFYTHKVCGCFLTNSPTLSRITLTGYHVYELSQGIGQALRNPCIIMIKTNPYSHREIQIPTQVELRFQDEEDAIIGATMLSNPDQFVGQRMENIWMDIA